MPTYMIGIHACPDGYVHVWRVRGTDDATGDLLPGYEKPTSCPRCKTRFDTAWSEEKSVKFFKREFPRYRDWLVWRNEQKRGKKK